MRALRQGLRRLGALQGGRAHAWALVGVMVAYAAAYVLVVPRIGPSFGSALTLPVVLAGWWFGPRWALGVAFGAIGLTLGLHAAVGRDLTDAFLRSLAGDAALVLVGLAAGWGAVIYRTQERQRAAVIEAEARARRLAEAAFDGIAIHENGVVREVNMAFARLFGYEPSELVGMRAHDLLDASAHPALEEHLRTRNDDAYGVVGRTKQGRRILLEVQARDCRFEGRPARVTAVRDVTHRIAAEGALRESEERFRTLFENVTLGLYRTTPDGRVLLANPALVRMLGYSSVTELMDQDLNADDGALVTAYSRKDWIDRLEREGQVVGLETEWRRKDGSTIFVRESARAIAGPDGRTLHYEGAVEDLTERKRLEQEREGQREAIARSERLSSLGTLVAGVAHEINNPLTYLSGNIELALLDIREASDKLAGVEDAPDLEATARGLERALAGAERIGQITRALKAVARQRSSREREREVVDLNVVLADAGALLEVGVPPGITLEVCPAPRPIHVEANVAEMHQVLLNLARNAIEALQGRERGHVRLSAAEDGKIVTIRVEDDGPGIPPDVVAKIFTPFFTTKPQGTGLGLSIVHGIVRDHNGDITLTSDPRSGSIFSVHLPLSPKAAALTR